ncbi:MAG: hypothetical protein IJ193_09560 [Bacilli bacterium]|nr:hypothetical protein [Bacilli bacterium]
MAIKRFDCTEDFTKFIKKQTNGLIGFGSEGYCYSGKDGYAYKVYGEGGPFRKVEYSVNDIVKVDDFKDKKFKHFAFPIDIYEVGNTIRSYKTIQFEGEDLIRLENISDVENIDSINFKKFSKAYKSMAKEVFMLSEENVEIVDLWGNILFDGETMLGIDTCNFLKNKPNILARNIYYYNCAIEDIFSIWLREGENLDFHIEGVDIDSFLKKVVDYVPEDIRKRNPKQFRL